MVAKDYQAEYPDPIAVEAGEMFVVSDRTSDWENNPEWIWVWCTDQREKSGWVPKNLIQMNADGQTGSTHAAYNAIELTVTAGQELTIEKKKAGGSGAMISKESTVGFQSAMLWHSSDLAYASLCPGPDRGRHTLVEKP